METKHLIRALAAFLCVLALSGCTSIKYGQDGFSARSLFSDKQISGLKVKLDENGKPIEISIESYVNAQSQAAEAIARGVASGLSPIP